MSEVLSTGDVNLPGWNLTTLHEHLTLLINERTGQNQESIVRLTHEFHSHLEQVTAETKAALTASDKAITKAEAATDKALEKVARDMDNRFHGVNEFRRALSDQTATFVPRKEIESAIDRTDEKVNALSVVVRGQPSRQEVDGSIQRMEERIRDLNDRVTRAEGAKQGINGAYVAALGLIGAIGTVIAVILATR